MMVEQTLPAEFYQWMEELQSVDFVLVELTLYLDTHPEDQNAIHQFNQYALQRKKIKKAIESKYGPLQQYGNSYSGMPWNWSSGPWPWQL
jgi:spore coat protein JB